MKKCFFLIITVFLAVEVYAGSLAYALDQGLVIPFTGVVDFNQAHAEVKIGRSEGIRSIMLKAAMTGRGMYHVKMDIAHIPLPALDVAAVIEGDVTITGDNPKAREFVGEFKSSYALLNYAPFRDAQVKCAIRNRKFILELLWVGGFLGSGEVQLTGKREMDLKFEAVAADLQELSTIIRAAWGMSGSDPLGVSGVMKGELNLQGVWPRPHVHGRLLAHNGTVQLFNFDQISLDFDGHFPFLNINEAMVTQSGGLSFRLTGPLNVMNPTGLSDQVKRLKQLPTITADDNRREWVFKRLASSDEARTEMKCLYLKNDRGDTEAVLGIQKSIGF